jgi:signal transduction histidine kinase
MSKKLNTTISAFSHEIKNPLHSAAINLEVLRTRLTKSTMREAKELLKHAEIIDKDLRSLQQIVEQFILDIGKSI